MAFSHGFSSSWSGVWFLALVAGLLSTLCPCGFFTFDLVLALEHASPWNFLCCVLSLGLCLSHKLRDWSCTQYFTQVIFFFTQIFYVTSLWTCRLGLLAHEPKDAYLWSLHLCGLVPSTWALFAGLCVVC
jgi:hypothetical protein